MKNVLKRIGAIVLALTLVLSIGAVAFAAEDMDGEGGVIGEFQSADTPDNPAKDTSVIIYKEITAYNPETCTVNAPAMTYNYTIASGDAGKDILDVKTAHNPQASAHVKTKAGIGTPTITGTAAGVLELVPGTNTLNASADGTANRFPLTVSFAGIDYTPSTIPSGHTEAEYGAGVYRYVISETTIEATKNASGIKEGSGANTLYMDVYVDSNGDIYGYVLFTNNNSIDASDGATANTVAEAGKVEGFVDTNSAAGTSTADEYFTFNLEVSKTVSGDTFIQGTHHEFPFHVTLDNPTVTADVLPRMTVGTYATQATLTAGPIGSATNAPANATVWTPTIGHEGKVTYVGIPCGTTVTIYEENNVLGTTYAASVTGADAAVTTKNIYYDGTTLEASNTATVNCGATALTAATENHTSTATTPKAVAFTNTLLQISPTGVVVRVAPFVLILAVGLVLVLAMVRRRREVEA